MLCPTCKRSFPPSRRVCPTDGVELIPEGDETSAWGVEPVPDQPPIQVLAQQGQAPQGPYQPGQMGPADGQQGPPVEGGTEPIKPISLMPAEPQQAPEPPPAEAPVDMAQMAAAADQAQHQDLIPSPFDNIPYDGGLEDPSRDQSSTRLEPGQMVDEYKVTGMLGEGGMGAVYHGIQPVIGKRVAIKVLLQEFSSNEKVVKRFIQEARAVNQIRSRYIVDIFSFGRLDNGRPYFVMEHLDGSPLRDFIKDRGTLSFDEAYAILRCVCKGLASAHAGGIVHRDLKPENIIVLEEEDGPLSAKILDFGIAKLQTGPGLGIATQTGVAMGTPYYMSPEQVRGVDVDHLSDIYALGIIMFEMFTGSLPFTANSYIELVNKHLFTAPPIPSKLAEGIPKELESLILRCIEKDKAGRPQSMKELFDVLQAMAPHVTGMTFPSLSAQPGVGVTPETPTVHEPGQNAQPMPYAEAQQASAAPYVPPQQQAPAPQAPVQAPVAQPPVQAPVAQPPPPKKKGGAGLLIGLLLVLLVLGGGGGAAYYFLVLPAGGPQKFLAAYGLGGGTAGTTRAGDDDTKGGDDDTKDGDDDTKDGDDDTKGGDDDTKGGDDDTKGGDTKGGDTKGGDTKGGDTKGGDTDADKPARLTVKVTNVKATFDLDGKTVGTGRSISLEVPPGKHTLTVSARGRLPWKKEFVAAAGGLVSFDMELKRKKGGRIGGKKGTTTKPTKGTTDDPDKTLNPFSGR